MRVCYRIAVLRRQVKQLVAIAAERAAQADGYCGDDRFQLLTEAETESILGAEWLARLRRSLGGSRT